ncbi:hypothetical protein QBC42DRAFT_99922 [Cladorrhinum samala]|uniref:SH3 domain-containing protein n=1 Tax=Cladorrhinum samala TaxID=585594 RepID=A0AAV9HLK5_9PEZI|nr:hypothetical protein QBC42DRAFT_99922 [Cladorrhinum samala]
MTGLMDKMRHGVADVLGRRGSKADEGRSTPRPGTIKMKAPAPAAQTQAPNLDLRAIEARQGTPTEIPNPDMPAVTEITSAVGPVPTDRIILDTTFQTSSSKPSATLDSTPTAATAAPSSSSTGSANGDGGGLSTAAKAGIAMGALGGVLLIFVIVYFIVSSRKKKLEKRKQQIEDDEKINGPFTDKAAMKSSAEAPRLSLRPVTQLWPGVDTKDKAAEKSGTDKTADKTTDKKAHHPERRASRGLQLNLSTVPSASSPTGSNHSPLNRPAHGGSAWERPTISSTTPTGNRPDTNISFYSTNPFNDNQALTVNNEPVSPVSTIDREAAFDGAANATTATSTKDSTPEPVSPIDREDPNAEFDAAAAAAAAKTERRTSLRQEGTPAPLDLTRPFPPAAGLNAVPPSPCGTEYSMHSMAPGQQYPVGRGGAEIAAAGGPEQSTVHRVQLDFKPTLQDELSLKAGQLVRLLHEYDDGWALCIRLDRTEQGVVPRTCLSTRPVKPRSHGQHPPQVPKKDSNASLRSAGGSSSRYSPHESRDHSPAPTGSGGNYYAPSQQGRSKSPLSNPGDLMMPPPGQAY